MSDGLPQTTSEALVAEAVIAERAALVRSEHRGGIGIDRTLFMKLWPLLCEPIQPAFIQTVAPTKGKPYPSTGIRSVQVQIDRMNNVLGPHNWWYEDEYELEGKLCTVRVCVGMRGGLMSFGPIVTRTSKGGVNVGSTLGNIYKGSFTNAAKRAFAALGVGHEVYVGATDLDPDVSTQLAGEAASGEAGTIGTDIAKKIVDHAWLAEEKDRLRLAASKLAQRDVGDCSTKAKAADSLAGALTFAQAEELDNWLNAQADKKATGGGR